MKNLKISVVEKGTKNVQLAVVISGVPESLQEIVELTQAEQADRAMSYFMAGLEASAKGRLEDGEQISYNDLLQRAGRRTQTGLIQSIMQLIPEAAGAGAIVQVGELVRLQANVMSDYKGRADEYYSEYRKLFAEVQAAKAE